MRTDVTVDTEKKLRLPQIPLFSPGRCHEAGRGDYVEWETRGSSYRGRAIGVVTNPDDSQELLCVAMQMLGGCVCERWVDPSWVIDARSSSDAYEEKSRWLHSEDFLSTHPDKATNAFNLLTEELL